MSSGGLYRSAHAAQDGGRPTLDGATLISADPAGSAGSEEPPGEDPPRPTVAGDSGGTAGNSAIMAIGSLVSRIIGFVRNALIGMTLGGGAGTIGDAYVSAQFLPNQIYELLLGGVLSSVLVPMLVRRRKSEPDGGQAYIQKLLTLAVVSLAVAALIVTALASVITTIQASGGSDEYGELVEYFSYLMLPMIFFLGLSALIGAVLNVHGHFAAPMWAPILNNIVVIAACGVFIAVFGSTAGFSLTQMTPGRITLIGGATLLGVAVQAVGLLPALRKVGFVWKWRWDPRSLGLGELGKLAGWMLCYVGANQVAVFVMVSLVNRIPEGGDRAGLVAFNNVFLLVMMAHGIIGVSVMTALMPKMSAAAADGRYADIAADLSRGIRMTTTALAPIVAVYAVLATPIAVTLFQGGAFTLGQAWSTGTVLLVGAFTVLPMSIMYLCTYSFYALQGNKTVALINLPVVVIRIGVQVALFFALPLEFFAAAVTAANGISYLASASISLTVLRRRIGRLGLSAVAVSAGKASAAALAAAVVGLLVVWLLPGGARPDRVEALLAVAVGGTVIMGSYVAFAYLLRVNEIKQVIGMVRRKIGR